jgi:small-conductance mechanosensitive channel
VILQTAGIDLTTLNILAGAVGIGVGFGLQNIANNFISGLIILFERPIKIGDRIVVGEIEGDVVSIDARSTTVLTNDNIAIIVPNSKFITENVINWSHNDPKIRFRIPITVAYGTETRLVERLLLEVAAENNDVLNDPAPGVRLIEFGDNGLHFELRAWTTALLHRRGLLVSALNFAIYDKLREHGIEIPFPQRDIHIRSSPSPIAKDS